MGLNTSESGLWAGYYAAPTHSIISGNSTLLSSLTSLAASGEVVPAPSFAPPTWIEYDNTHVASPTRALGTGPFTDVSASFWMKTDDAAHVDVGLFSANSASPSPGGSSIWIKTLDGQLVYSETSDNDHMWEHIWGAALPTDGEWHHYGVKAGVCYIDGDAVTFTDSGMGVESGSVHPSVAGNASVLCVRLLSGKHASLADVRLFKMASNVQAQAIYGSPLLNDGATTIVGAWRMGDGPGASTAFDRSVKAVPLDVVTGMTWGGVKDTRILVVGWDTGMYVSPHTGDNWALPVATGEWGCCAMDKTGQYMLSGSGIDFPGQLKVSTDYGATWVTRNPGGGDPNRDWSYGCAISGDASIMLATDTEALYKSTDHGANWTTVNPGGVGAFGRMAADSDGSVLAVLRSNHLWVSTNGGTSWADRGGFGTGYSSVAMSDDGSVIVVAYGSGTPIPGCYVTISTNSGVNWSTPQLVSSVGAVGAACDADGSVIVVGGGDHFATSADGGATWNVRKPEGETHNVWSAFTVSADGKTITAFNYASKGYRSFDGGVNWTEITPTGVPGGGFYDAAGSRS